MCQIRNERQLWSIEFSQRNHHLWYWSWGSDLNKLDTVLTEALGAILSIVVAGCWSALSLYSSNCLCPIKRCRLSTPQSYSVSYDPHKNLLNDGGDKDLIVASLSLWVVVGRWPKEEVNYRWPLKRKSSRSVIVLSIAVAIDLIVLHIGELLRSGNGASAANYLDDVFSMQQQQQKPRRDREH